MKAVLLSGERTIEVTDVDEPELGDDDVLIDVRATGICGSDMHAYRGFHPFRRPPVILGHEAAGEVVEVAANVTSIRPGDRVAVEPQIACRRCARCLDGQANLCANIQRPGQPGTGWSGTFAERIVAPSTAVYALAPTTSFAEGAMIEPLAVSYRAFRRGGVTLGMRVAVLGVGNIGALFAHLCARAQVSLLMVTDVKEYNLAFASSIMTCAAVDARTEDVVERGLDLTAGEGFDVVAVASGAPSSLLDAVELCRPGGVVVVISIFPDAIRIDATRMVYRELNLRASLTYTPKDFRDATQLVNGKTMDLRPYITRSVGLGEAEAVFREMDAGLDYIKVMFDLDKGGG